jgi:adenylate cyclase
MARPSTHDRWLLVLVVLLGVLLLDHLGPRWVSRFDVLLGDQLVARHAATRPADPDVVLVSIDERSLSLLAEEFGRWPWPRSAHAELAEGLRAAGAAAVVFDVLLTDPDLDHADADAWFVETVRNDDRIYLPMVRLDPAADAAGLELDAHGERIGLTRTAAALPGARLALALPFADAAETGRLGTINFLPDADGVGRRYWVWMEEYGWRLPSLPARVASDLGWPISSDPAVEINWRSGDGVPTWSFADVLGALRDDPASAATAFAGKVLVVGSDAASLGDVRPTPLSRATPGAEILVAALTTLKQGDGLRRTGSWFAALLSAALLMMLGYGAHRGAGPARLAVALAAAAGIALVVAWLGIGRGWLLPLAQPLFWGAAFVLAMVGAAWLEERQARVHVQQTFGRFVDPRVVADLVRTGGVPALRGETREITVLFSDIRGFTSLSESRPPEEVVALLNRYFTRQVEVVFRHGGTVDKFIGDCIMAFWGAPVQDSDHAAHAVAAALEMARVAAEFRDELPGTVFEVGIGLNSGPATVGLMGAPSKLDYTVIGDTVNLASRIEGCTKGVATILVSDATRAACGGRFRFVEHGSFKVKGRDAEVGLHEPMGE